jgi:hypothetical protein
MFVEEGFRIRFGNGEVIDFYADVAGEKDAWMAALSQVVGKGIQASSTSTKGWADLVLKREKKLKVESAVPRSRPNHQRTETYGGAASQANSPVKSKMDPAERQRKAKSMMM